MSLHIQRYIDQTTLEEFPFIQRLNYAYIEAFIFGSQWFKDVVQIESYFEPLQSWFLFNELDPRAAAYSGPKYLPIFAYAVQRKDLVGIQMVADAFRLGVAEYRYGEQLFENIIETTDPVHEANTDEGYTTDMTASSYPVMVVFLDFSYNSSTGIDLLDDVWARVSTAANLFTLVKPARTPLVFLRRPNYVVSRFTHQGVALNNEPNWSSIDALSPAARSHLFMSIDAHTPEKYWSSRIYSDENKRIWTVFSDGKINKITITSGNPDFEDLEVIPDWDPAIFEPGEGQESSPNFNKYCCRICLNLSNEESNDTFAEVIYGR